MRVEEVEVCAWGRWRMWSKLVAMDEYICGECVHLCHSVTCRDIRHTCVMAHVTLCVCRMGDGTIGRGGGHDLRVEMDEYMCGVCMSVTLLCVMTYVTHVS